MFHGSRRFSIYIYTNVDLYLPRVHSAVAFLTCGCSTFWLFMFQLLYTFKGQLHNDLNQADLASVAALTAIHFHLIVNKRRRG